MDKTMQIQAVTSCGILDVLTSNSKKYLERNWVPVHLVEDMSQTDM